MTRDLRKFASEVTAALAFGILQGQEELERQAARQDWFIIMAALGFSRDEVQRELDAGRSRDQLYRSAVEGVWRSGESWSPVLPVRRVAEIRRDQEAERVTCPFCGTAGVLVRSGALYAHFPVMPGGRCPAAGETLSVAQEMADLRGEIRSHSHP